MGVLDELVGVAISGHDEHVVTPGRGLRCEGRDHVVGLEAAQLHHRDVQGVDQLTNQAHLLPEDVGCLGPARLVVGDDLVAEGRLRPIEGGDDLVGLMILDQVDQHGSKPVHGVGHLPGRSRHVRRQGEERPVGQ